MLSGLLSTHSRTGPYGLVTICMVQSPSHPVVNKGGSSVTGHPPPPGFSDPDRQPGAPTPPPLPLCSVLLSALRLERRGRVKNLGPTSLAPDGTGTAVSVPFRCPYPSPPPPVPAFASVRHVRWTVPAGCCTGPIPPSPVTQASSVFSVANWPNFGRISQKGPDNFAAEFWLILNKKGRIVAEF